MHPPEIAGIANRGNVNVKVQPLPENRPGRGRVKALPTDAQGAHLLEVNAPPSR